MQAATEKIWTVSQLNGAIELLLRKEFQSLWLKGEISNFRRQSTGHCYFTLKDENGQISAVLFRGNAEHCQMPLADGREIFVYGEISVYSPRGTYQIIVRHVLDKGFGELQIRFEKLKNRLTDEGLFSPERKKNIPKLPHRIGIITSSEGAALRDFLSVLKRRNWNGECIILPASVQGKNSVQEVISMLHLAPTLNLDLVIIARGGGSIEDLWSFNEEALVRAVAACPIPTISAIGHETDFTLCDFAADLRVETPTAAAEKITSAYLAAQDLLQKVSFQLSRLSGEHFRIKQHQIALLAESLKIYSPEALLSNAMLRMDDLSQRLSHATAQELQEKSRNIQALKTELAKYSPQKTLDLAKQEIENLKFRFEKSIYQGMVNRLESIQHLERRLQNSGLQKTLSRGFSYFQNPQGNTVKSVSQVSVGEKLSAHFSDGSMDVEVNRINPNK